MSSQICWKNIFNTSHAHYGHISEAHKSALAAGYPYFLWNDRVYETGNVGQPTNYISLLGEIVDETSLA